MSEPCKPHSVVYCVPRALNSLRGGKLNPAVRQTCGQLASFRHRISRTNMRPAPTGPEGSVEYLAVFVDREYDVNLNLLAPAAAGEGVLELKLGTPLGWRGSTHR